MTPRELHTAVAQLWPDSTGNEFMLARLRVIEAAAVSGDYDGFADYAMRHLYYPAATAHAGCLCWSCEKARVMKKFVSHRESVQKPQKEFGQKYYSR